MTDNLGDSHTTSDTSCDSSNRYCTLTDIPSPWLPNIKCNHSKFTNCCPGHLESKSFFSDRPQQPCHPSHTVLDVVELRNLEEIYFPIQPVSSLWHIPSQCIHPRSDPGEELFDCLLSSLSSSSCFRLDDRAVWQPTGFWLGGKLKEQKKWETSSVQSNGVSQRIVLWCLPFGVPPMVVGHLWQVLGNT